MTRDYMLVMDMMNGHMLTKALYVAAELNIAELLAEEPLTAEQIATKVGADPDAIFRLLRALATRDVFTQQSDGRFALTALAETLRAEAADSVRAQVIMAGHKVPWANWGELGYSVRTGKPSHEHVHGMAGFEYLGTDPDFANAFNESMTRGSQLAVKQILETFDFSGFHTIMDVGGGRGRLLAAILAANPEAKGVLYDMPSVVEGAADVLSASGVLDRCTIESGSFFDSVPSGADTYVLKHVVHDWSDEDALRILGSVRKSIGPNGTLLLIEYVIPSGNVAHYSKWLDLEMLVQIGGRERTDEQYQQLLDMAGFRQTRLLQTNGPLSIVEATPA